MKVDDQRQGARPEYVRQALEDSLRRLGTDYVDLYQLHQPDPGVLITETLDALTELVRAGKVREIGCSNFTAEQLRVADETARMRGNTRFVSVQNQFSLLHREPEREVLKECERLGIAFLPYFPLANGLLTGKYRLGQPAPPGTRLSGPRAAATLNERNLATVERLFEFAASRGHNLLELAVSWLLAHRVVASVIAGATSPEQVRANVAAAGWKLSAEEMAEVDRILVRAEAAEPD
jgi:aryl-alcohol dehydrogenase-like predicted oxidoreductase